MRLICPNCDAQYEVPTDVMPIEGRDVQCSNCGYTWFQSHPDAPQDNGGDQSQKDPAAEDVAPEPNEPVAETQSAVQPDSQEPVTEPPSEEPITSEPADVQEPMPEAASADPDVPAEEPTDSWEETDLSDTDDEQPAQAIPARRELDPAVADVLRAEAELEELARRNEMTAMESQPELGLPEGATESAVQRAEQARTRMARMRGARPDDGSAMAASVTETSTASRRDLLPDIEEINSTLRSNSDRSPATDPGQTAQLEVREKRSSARGFTLAVALFTVFVLIYVFAPEIGESVPLVQVPLTAYVETIDAGRGWLDAQVVNLLGWLDQTAQSASE